MTGAEPPQTIDHKEGNRDDNRWEQLRPATQQQQIWNRSIFKNNLSGFRGVNQERGGRYRARIRVGGKRIQLGTFSTPQEASAVYEAAARQLRGEFYRA
jgi:hypothetical protein